MPGYLVAGKTGTAAKPDPSGGYSDTRYVASFVGIVPASAPRLVVLVSINEPQGQIFGGVVAAPAFRDIARFALQYLDVPPDDVVVALERERRRSADELSATRLCRLPASSPAAILIFGQFRASVRPEKSRIRGVLGAFRSPGGRGCPC